MFPVKQENKPYAWINKIMDDCYDLCNANLINIYKCTYETVLSPNGLHIVIYHIKLIMYQKG